MEAGARAMVDGFCAVVNAQKEMRKLMTNDNALAPLAYLRRAAFWLSALLNMIPDVTHYFGNVRIFPGRHIKPESSFADSEEHLADQGMRLVELKLEKLRNESK